MPLAATAASALRPSGRVLLIDMDPTALKRELRVLGKRSGGVVSATFGRPVARRLTVDPTCLPMKDQLFDVISLEPSIAVDPVRTARELIRVSLPGGTIVTAGETAASAVKRALVTLGCRPLQRPRDAAVRLPGPRAGAMPVRTTGLPGLTAARVRACIAGLPVAHGYEVVVKPLRYRTRPHVQAFCEFDARLITIQVPVPFRPFVERVPYRAKRIRGKGLRFRWFERQLTFDDPETLIRYLYLHEYYHWYLREVLGRPSAAETACDRFALQRM